MENSYLKTNRWLSCSFKAYTSRTCHSSDIWLFGLRGKHTMMILVLLSIFVHGQATFDPNLLTLGHSLATSDCSLRVIGLSVESTPFGFKFINSLTNFHENTRCVKTALKVITQCPIVLERQLILTVTFSSKSFLKKFGQWLSVCAIVVAQSTASVKNIGIHK